MKDTFPVPKDVKIVALAGGVGGFAQYRGRWLEHLRRAG